MRWLALLVAAALLTGCGEPDRDEAAWDEATDRAEWACGLKGWPMYSEEYENCVADQTEVKYADLMEDH